MMPDSLCRTLGLVAAVVALWLAGTPPVAARKARTDIVELSARSDAIAVARVDRVLLHGGMRIAVATVLRPIKGLNANQRFSFLAEPTWTCDSSTAVLGETVLLFLERPGDGFDNWLIEVHPDAWERRAEHPARPFFKVAWSGSGRMPVTEWASPAYLEGYEGPSMAAGRQTPSVWVGDVEFPAALIPADTIRKSGVITFGGGRHKVMLVSLEAVERYLRQSSGHRSTVSACVADTARRVWPAIRAPTPRNNAVELLGWIAAACTCTAASFWLLARALRALPSVRR